MSLAFGDMGGGLRRLIQIVFGLSIAFAATSFFLSFFSFAGGALINELTEISHARTTLCPFPASRSRCTGR